MTTEQTALENLRIIRSLMEKAHIYRTISGAAALFGGCLTLGVAAWLVMPFARGREVPSPATFLMFWIATLAVTGAVNTILLARDAARREQPFVSDGMLTALWALLPPMLVGGVVGIGLILLQNMVLGTLVWTLCYGLALVATGSFSPRSLVRLGWCFIFTGLALFLFWASNQQLRMLATDEGPGAIVMALTFGLLHIGYGAAVALNKKPEVPAE